MAGYLGIEREKIAIVPLGLDTRDFDRKDGETERQRDGERKQLNGGYLARLSPEKGLHVLAEAFIRLHQMPGMDSTQLRIAGWLGDKNRENADGVFPRLKEAGLVDAFEYVGEVDRQGKLDFLASLDVLAV